MFAFACRKWYIVWRRLCKMAYEGHKWHSYLKNVCMVSSDCEYLLGSSGLEPQADVRGIGPVLHFFRSSAHASRVLEQVHAGKANRWTWRGLPCFCLGLLQPQRLQVQAAYSTFLFAVHLNLWFKTSWALWTHSILYSRSPVLHITEAIHWILFWLVVSLYISVKYLMLAFLIITLWCLNLSFHMISPSFLGLYITLVLFMQILLLNFVSLIPSFFQIPMSLHHLVWILNNWLKFSTLPVVLLWIQSLHSSVKSARSVLVLNPGLMHPLAFSDKSAGGLSAGRNRMGSRYPIKS